ncbi:hypothetical protein APX70_101038, partial [Pseudomonas syringae pv. maculicola]
MAADRGRELKAVLVTTVDLQNKNVAQCITRQPDLAPTARNRTQSCQNGEAFVDRAKLR